MDIEIYNENLRLKSRIDELERKLKDTDVSQSFINNISVFIDCIYVPIFIKDKNGAYINCNYAFEDFTGFKRNEIIGKSALDVFGRENAEEIIKEDRAVTEEGNAIIKEKDIRVKSGKTLRVRVIKNSLPLKHTGIVAIIGIISDITRQKEFERSLLDVTRKLNKSQAVGKIGSWEFDVETGRIWASDTTFSILFLNKSSSFIDTDTFLTNAVSEEHRKRFYRALEKIEITKSEMSLFMPVYDSVSGKTSYLRILGECILTDDGECKKISGIIQDVTSEKNEEIERELLIKKLEKALLKANETSKIKEEFLAMMSHEIRTPLTGIIGFSQLIKKNIPESYFIDNDKHKDYVESIINSAKRLNDLLNNLLALSEFEATQNGGLQFYEFDIRDIISGIRQLFQGKLDEKGLSFKVDIKGDGIVFSNRVRIEHILLNIIGNAIKFTDKGFVEVSYKKDSDFYVVSISDSGIGIEKNKQKDIFEMFKQVNLGVNKRKYQGVGLGLSICKKFIKSLEGEITVESKSGTGSVFKVYIPIKQKY